MRNGTIAWMLVIITCLAALLALVTAVRSDEHKTFYGPNGQVLGRSVMTGNGQTTFYDANGAVIGRTQAIITGTKPKPLMEKNK